jgi:hypothetical protein
VFIIILSLLCYASEMLHNKKRENAARSPLRQVTEAKFPARLMNFHAALASCGMVPLSKGNKC